MVKFLLILALSLAFPLQGFCTTIAYDGNLLAADSQTTSGSAKSLTRQKISDVGTCYVAGAGVCQLVDNFVDTWKKSTKEEAIKYALSKADATDSANILIIDKQTGDASVLTIVKKRYFEEMAHLPIAIGSGKDFALSAMHCGYSAEGAVTVASQYDLYTGGKVHSVVIKAVSN